jgi:ferredoxin
MTTEKITMKIGINEDNCVACGYCASGCPANVFFIENDVVHINRSHLETVCTQCGACEVVCEYDALTVIDMDQYVDY